MGFFKKIGKAIKKNVSFKNLVKTVGSVAQFVPVVGGAASSIIEGAQAQHYAQKEAHQQALAQAQAEANAVQAVGGQNGYTKDPNIRDILVGAAGGALTGAGNVLGGGATAGQAGATVVDSTLSAWFKNHLKHILIGVGGLVAIIVAYRFTRPTKRRSYR